MEVFQENGIKVLGKTIISLDGKRKEGINVVSHAHKDHIGNFRKAVATRETARLAGLEEHTDSLVLDGLEIKLRNAGHILGSSQVEITDGLDMVYTGDIRLRDSLLFKGADILNPDVLILEATFGLPRFVFPPLEEVLSSMESWVRVNLDAGRHVILGGYALGKAQELTRFVNDIGETPIVTRDIWDNNRVYDEFGVPLGEYLLSGTREAMERARDPSVFVVPLRLLKKAREALELSYNRNVVSAAVTGWAVMFSFRDRADMAFPLSDHSDFHDITDYAMQSGARHIYTVHGYKNELARHLTRLGLRAEPLLPRRGR